MKNDILRFTTYHCPFWNLQEQKEDDPVFFAIVLRNGLTFNFDLVVY